MTKQNILEISVSLRKETQTDGTEDNRSKLELISRKKKPQ